MDVMEAIRTRRAVRRYAEKAVEPEKLALILEAGRLAPTAKNQQTVKTVVVTDPALREALVPACMGQTFVGQAPVVLVVCADDERVMSCGQSARTMDCAIALSFMRLEATALGLQGCWLGRFDPEAVRKILQIPEQYVIAAVCPIGYPAGEGTPRPKKPVEEFSVFEKMQAE